MTRPRKEGRGPLGIGYVQMALAAFLTSQGFTAEQASRGWELLREENPALNIEEFVAHLKRVADRLRAEDQTSWLKS